MNKPEYFFWRLCHNFSVRLLKSILKLEFITKKLSIKIELKRNVKYDKNKKGKNVLTIVYCLSSLEKAIGCAQPQAKGSL